MKILANLIPFLLCYFSPIYASCFYAILVGNVSDKKIAGTVICDIKKIKAELLLIAEYTGQNLQLIELEKSYFREEDLQCIFRINPTVDDTLFFYQSSHGFRFPDKIGEWPTLDFNPFHIDFETIVDCLTAKHPRLLICVADVCNSNRPFRKLRSAPFKFQRCFIEESIRSKKIKGREKKEAVYKELFSFASGTILVSSAKPGQLSFSLFNKGGIFTNSLIRSIEKAARGEIAGDWTEVLDEVVKQTTRAVHKEGLPSQIPQFKIF